MHAWKSPVVQRRWEHSGDGLAGQNVQRTCADGSAGQTHREPNDKGFVGGTQDNTGLTHLSAREYDPSIGRFISLDPVMDLTGPQRLHGYTYANNTPVTQSDPSGLDPGGGQCADSPTFDTALAQSILQRTVPYHSTTFMIFGSGAGCARGVLVFSRGVAQCGSRVARSRG
jgi:RHS repeat-associated protein